MVAVCVRDVERARADRVANDQQDPACTGDRELALRDRAVDAAARGCEPGELTEPLRDVAAGADHDWLVLLQPNVECMSIIGEHPQAEEAIPRGTGDPLGDRRKRAELLARVVEAVLQAR